MWPAPADPDPELIESLVTCPVVLVEGLSLVKGARLPRSAKPASAP
jgi:hypothetical protein